MRVRVCVRVCACVCACVHVCTCVCTCLYNKHVCILCVSNSPNIHFDHLCVHIHILTVYLRTYVGILNKDGTIDNEKSIQRLAEVALAYAKAGELGPVL